MVFCVDVERLRTFRVVDTRCVGKEDLGDVFCINAMVPVAVNTTPMMVAITYMMPVFGR